jgi:hypothetical protein
MFTHPYIQQIPSRLAAATMNIAAVFSTLAIFLNRHQYRFHGLLPYVPFFGRGAASP